MRLGAIPMDQGTGRMVAKRFMNGGAQTKRSGCFPRIMAPAPKPIAASRRGHPAFPRALRNLTELKTRPPG
ncbi:MAG: hypothetical protein M2R46_05640 [Verrucomicrobia subdivision 3 bacterium]|nr:hypothetical protein [Limisphaerales bacterium]